MIRAASIAVLLLAGCASYSERMAQEPMAAGRTDKTPDEFVACAMPVMMNTWRTAVLVPDGDARSILVRDNLTSAVQGALTARADGRVELRGQRGFRGTWPLIEHCL